MPSLPPANRIVAFAGPYVSVAAGGIASWLVANVNIAGIPGLDENNVKTTIAGGFTWLLVAGLTWAGHSKWLTGHHIQLEADGKITAAMTAASAAPTTSPVLVAATSNGNGHHPDTADDVDVDDTEDPATESATDGALVSDDVEFAYPPTPAADRPIEPEDDR
jgi:hypothetical protein